MIDKAIEKFFEACDKVAEYIDKIFRKF